MADPRYLVWVRKQKCVCQPCASKPDPHHSTVAPTYAPGERLPKQRSGLRGKAQKSADYYAFPLCPRHHGQFHKLTGYFDGWEKVDLRNWQENMSAEARARYERRPKPARQDVRWGRDLKTSLAQAVAEFARELDLSDQKEFDLKRLVERARREGREEERQAGRPER